jgi:hypothetical protein
MRVLPVLLILCVTCGADARGRVGVRAGMSNEGAPLVGAEYVHQVGRYLQLIPSVDAIASDEPPWIALDAALRIPIFREYAIALAGGFASVSEFRTESKRVLAPEAALHIGGRGYFFIRSIAARERRIAIGGGFRF